MPEIETQRDNAFETCQI